MTLDEAIRDMLGEYPFECGCVIEYPERGVFMMKCCALHANAAALLEEFRSYVAQHRCGCNHPACKSCKNDKLADEAIAACEED